MNKVFSTIRRSIQEFRDFLDERGVDSGDHPHSHLYRIAHFWLLVIRSFVRNRCPVRASALAYTTLLALIPMIFVAVSVSSSILKNQGDEKITQLVEKLVTSVIPPVPEDSSSYVVSVDPLTGEPVENAPSEGATHRVIVQKIKGFVQNIQSGTLGVTGMILLVFMAVSMLIRIEETFNDIWGVSQGRSLFARIVQYWAVISLGPVLLVVALGLTSGPHLQGTKELIGRMPLLGNLFFQLLPVVVLCLTFSLFYMLMPNTKVHWKSAMMGGLVGGVLWHINNVFSVLYVSRVVTNSKIYGSLGIVPVFMIGLYFSWIILLFGAQVAYASQNRKSYLQEKQTENINQRGREFVALRLMAAIGRRFHHGLKPATLTDLSTQLCIPSRLAQQVLQVLLAAHLVVKVAGQESAYAPARPLETITCHDILLALRAGQGQELATRDEPARREIYGEFERILEAERSAASVITVLAMVDRADALANLESGGVKAVTDAPSSQTKLKTEL